MPGGASLQDDAGVDRALRRSGWLKTLLRWHWISSAVCLIGLLLFAFTGITLNHAGQLEAGPRTERRTAQLPSPLKEQLMQLAQAVASGEGKGTPPLPPQLGEWLEGRLRIELPAEPAAEWSAGELYVSLPRPGGDAWLRIALQDGSLEYELTDRGWVAYLNDLHKGRNTGTAWTWFLDVFAAGCLVFSITGLLILKMHATNRPLTWPLLGLGLVVPLLLAILFIH